MAEALALLGAVAATAQCVDIGKRLLRTGRDLYSRLYDAPDKLRRSLTQLQQLVDLIDLVKQQSYASSTSPLIASSQPGFGSVSPVTWLEAVIMDCTNQFQDLEAILKKMLSEIESKPGKVNWRSILTLKRERTISELFSEIERQKSALNLWLGHSTSRELSELHSDLNGLRKKIITTNDLVQLREDFEKTSEKLAREYSEITEGHLRKLQDLDRKRYASFEQRVRMDHCHTPSSIEISQSQLCAPVSSL